MIYRYYCLYRPPGPGAIPRGAVHVEDFTEDTYLPQIEMTAWGFAEYEQPLTERQVKDYELIGPEIGPEVRG